MECPFAVRHNMSVPSQVSQSAEWKQRVSTTLNAIVPHVKSENVAGLNRPTRGWNAILTERFKYAMGGFRLEEGLRADVLYAESDVERDFVIWFEDSMDRNVETSLISTLILENFPPPPLGQFVNGIVKNVASGETARIHPSEWRVKHRVWIADEQPEGTLLNCEQFLNQGKYPKLTGAFREYEVCKGFKPKSPRTLYLYGLTLAANPMGASLSAASHPVWKATMTLWVRNVAYELLEKAGAAFKGAKADFYGRLYWLSPTLRDAITLMNGHHLVDAKYDEALNSLIVWMKRIHWSQISCAQNEYPAGNGPDAFAPYYATADYVFFDCENWCPMVPDRLAPAIPDVDNPPDPGKHSRGNRLSGDLTFIRRQVTTRRRGKRNRNPNYKNTLWELDEIAKLRDLYLAEIQNEAVVNALVAGAAGAFPLAAQQEIANNQGQVIPQGAGGVQHEIVANVQPSGSSGGGGSRGRGRGSGRANQQRELQPGFRLRTGRGGSPSTRGRGGAGGH